MNPVDTFILALTVLSMVILGAVLYFGQMTKQFMRNW